MHHRWAVVDGHLSRESRLVLRGQLQHHPAAPLGGLAAGQQVLAGGVLRQVVAHQRLQQVGPAARLGEAGLEGGGGAGEALAGVGEGLLAALHATRKIKFDFFISLFVLYTYVLRLIGLVVVVWKPQHPGLNLLLLLPPRPLLVLRPRPLLPLSGGKLFRLQAIERGPSRAGSLRYTKIYIKMTFKK